MGPPFLPDGRTHGATPDEASPNVPTAPRMGDNGTTTASEDLPLANGVSKKDTGGELLSISFFWTARFLVCL
jgi:hypothetical protein